MGADSIVQFCTWVHAAYGVHPDLKIHIGSYISFGVLDGTFHSQQTETNTKSSTKAKVIVASDYLPLNITFCLYGITRI